MPRQIFKKRVIAAAGPLPGQLTDENLRRWTEARKGKFIGCSESSDDADGLEATHVLCTEEQFSQRVPRVKEALKRKGVHIVHHDWYEFSTASEKRQPERDYSMRCVLARERAIRSEQSRIQRGKRDAERFGVNTSLFHVYQDRCFFSYEIDLTRNDEGLGEQGQRFTLHLWESHAKPHLYWFTAKFLRRKGDGQPTYYRPSPCSGKWSDEMQHFTDFFRKKTGIDWEDRVSLRGTTPPYMFQYTPPTGGKPVGRRLRHEYDYCLEINRQLTGGTCECQGPVDSGDGDEASAQEVGGSIKDAECAPEGDAMDVDDQGPVHGQDADEPASAPHQQAQDADELEDLSGQQHDQPTEEHASVPGQDEEEPADTPGHDVEEHKDDLEQ